MFKKCNCCGRIEVTSKWKDNKNVCKICGYHGMLNSSERIRLIIDEDTFREMDADLGFHDPIHFPGYCEKYQIAHDKTGLNEAIMTGRGKINGANVIIGVMDARFMMSSMGAVIGEKIARAFERAEEEKVPVILFSASGGARMQEGVVSLMQMAKTSAAVAKYSESGGLYISILTNPTTGGVSASFSFLGDIIIAEPKALIGFAGKRVIQQTIQEKLPDNFQTSEYLMEHGFLDAIVERSELKEVIHQLISYHFVQEVAHGIKKSKAS